MESVYTNGEESALVDDNNRFIYEVTTCIYFQNTYSVVNNVLYSSDVEIKNIIKSYYVTPNIEICCKLYSAPLQWLRKNKFILWVKPEKKKRKQKIKKDVKKININ